MVQQFSIISRYCQAYVAGEEVLWFGGMNPNLSYALVMALYRSWPAVSHICAFIVLPSTWILLVANSTPMVLLLSRLNSFLVNLDSKLLFPTPESPINTTGEQTKSRQNQLNIVNILKALHYKLHLNNVHKLCKPDLLHMYVYITRRVERGVVQCRCPWA